MAYSKVLKDFSVSVYSDSRLIVKAYHIVDMMTGNAYFPNPSPALADVKIANDNFNVAVDKVENGSRVDTANKNDLREVLVALLRKLALYVEVISDGDETIILSSGFDVSKQPSVVGPLDKPIKISVTMGKNPGTVIFSCEVIKNAHFYEFEYLEAPKSETSVWIKVTSTKHKVTIEGLTSGKQYIFRVAAAGSDPSRNYSSEISVYVS